MTPVEWALLATMIIMTAYTLTHQPEGPPPPQPGQLDIPTCDEGTPVPVIFGEVYLKQTQIMDSFNAKSVAIKSKSGK